MHARVRAGAGRVATTVGAALLTGGLADGAVTVPGIIAAVGAAGVGLAANPQIWRATSARAEAIVIYALPQTGCAAILVGERLAPSGGVSVLAQAAVVALWTSATWYLRFGRQAQELVEEATRQEAAALAEADKQPDPAPAEVVPAPVYASAAARWWAEEIAVEDGIAPGTELLEYRRISEECVAAVIASVKRGTPVPEISIARLSAYLDKPQELIVVGPVPGRGAGLRLLTMGQLPAADPETANDSKDGQEEDGDELMWAQIAEAAMPGVQLIEANTYEMHKELT